MTTETHNDVADSIVVAKLAETLNGFARGLRATVSHHDDYDLANAIYELSLCANHLQVLDLAMAKFVPGLKDVTEGDLTMAEEWIATARDEQTRQAFATAAGTIEDVASRIEVEALAAVGIGL